MKDKNMTQKTYVHIFKNNSNAMEELTELMDIIENHHKISKDTVLQIRLSLEELIVNIMSYSYDDNKSHEIELKICVNENNLTFFLNDDGKPFNPLEVKVKNVDMSLKDRPIGGVGIVLAKTFMDKVSYKYQKGFNQLTLTKILP